ncbi:MAG: ribose-5-phosphate isomerase RpiA [Spirochaetaceae bacterium]
MSKDDVKRAVGFAAVDRYLEDARHIGLGSGSTAVWAIRRLAQVYQEQPAASPGGRGFLFVAASTQSLFEARALGLPVRDLDDPQLGGRLDLVIDGADEVDSQRRVIKGGGGALLREKILAYNAERVVLVVDAAKLSENLCERFAVPVEFVPGSYAAVFRALASMDGRPKLRMAEKKNGLVVTDNGNYIADVAFDPPIDAGHLEIAINSIPGVVENGLFTMMDPVVLVGREDGGVEEIPGSA